MGITINYEGNLDDPGKVWEFITHMMFKANEWGWPSWEVNERIIGHAYYPVSHEVTDTDRPGFQTGRLGLGLKPVDDRVRGLNIQPPGTEMLTLTFNRAGKMVFYTAMPGRLEPAETGLGIGMGIKEEPGFYLEHEVNWVKTTGQIKAHIQIVELLRDAQTHFISNLKVDDDTSFWESGDRLQLVQEHARMAMIIGMFRDPEMIKGLLEATGIEGITEITPVSPEDLTITEKKPDHTKMWGMSANEN